MYETAELLFVLTSFYSIAHYDDFNSAFISQGWYRICIDMWTRFLDGCGVNGSSEEKSFTVALQNQRGQELFEPNRVNSIGLGRNCLEWLEL
ncbi:unnamed protein product [Eruca vesicaria subsp. sativa]|uniref:Uncharacterized protein n=1 Tax=Eruca vesicaria subsp. sativa TaxID=29727 RepID=A0ABC8JRT2_ERUVS|nr:unnamed protein product [Eruca vesicaria subsp. sativa]